MCSVWSNVSAGHLQEHPIFGLPFFVVHPCHTARFMEVMRSNTTVDTPYLVTWLSAVGPLVGMCVAEEYASECAKTNC